MTETRGAAPTRRSYFAGRSNRAEYWFGVVVVFLVSIGLGFVPGLSDNVSTASTGGFIVVMWRRFHDFGRTGWLSVVAMVVLIVVSLILVMTAGLIAGLIMALVLQVGLIVWLGARRGDAGENRYGPPSRFDIRRPFGG